MRVISPGLVERVLRCWRLRRPCPCSPSAAAASSQAHPAQLSVQPPSSSWPVKRSRVYHQAADSNSWCSRVHRKSLHDRVICKEHPKTKDLVLWTNLGHEMFHNF